MPRAIDVSNFTGSIHPDKGPDLRDFARKMIANTHDPTLALGQLDTAAGACMERELYSQLYFDVPLVRELDNASFINHARPMATNPRLWLAFEDAVPAGISKDVVIAWGARAIDMAMRRGFNVGIYTRKSWWLDAMGDETWFSQFDLWDANHDNIPNLAEFTPYGGWTHATMKQYAADQHISGVLVDINVY